MKTEITEIDFFDALKLIVIYIESKGKTIESLSRIIGLMQTPNELDHTWKHYFGKLNPKVRCILATHFEDTKLCNIKKEEFLSKRSVGIKSWQKFCKSIGRKE